MTQFDSGRPDMWLSLALASALLLAVRRIYEKQLTAYFGNFSLSFTLIVFSLLPTLVLFFFLPLPKDVFHLSLSFWVPLLIIWAILYPVQNYFLYRSLREGELSEVTPVSALLPVFNVATSFLVIAEAPTVVGFAGILITVIATYLLLTDIPGGKKRNWYNKPVLFMVISVLCTAIGSTLDKVAIGASTPVFYTFVNLLGAAIVFLILTHAYKQTPELKQIPRFIRTFSLLGIVFALAFVTFAAAFSFGPTSYVLSIRSGGYILAALWGVVVLRESLTRQKIWAVGLFVVGTLLLAIG